MSTPTPRTDAVYLEHRYWANEDEATEAIEDLRDLARKLERELDAERETSRLLRVAMDVRDEGYTEMRKLLSRVETALATEREKVRVLKLDKDRLDWWNGEPYYQFGKSHKCMNPGWWWSCGLDQMHGKSGIKNIRDAIDSAMAHSKSGRNKYNVCDRVEKFSTQDKP